MKKLAAAVVSLAFVATPVLACPGHEEAPSEVKTADKDKAPAKTADKDKAKDADKVKLVDFKKLIDNKIVKPADPKKPDKVSSK